jgi:hypothetical protein
MLARQVTRPRSSLTGLSPLLRYSSELFVAAKELKSFTINQIRTLYAKCPGYGIPVGSAGHPGWGTSVNRFPRVRDPWRGTPVFSQPSALPGDVGALRQEHTRPELRAFIRGYSEGPKGRKYWVPFTGSCRRRRSCCRSALRSTKSISEVLITRRSDAA